MKMKLPKALLLAVLASVLVSNANATITTGTGNPDRPDIIKTVDSGTLDIKDDYFQYVGKITDSQDIGNQALIYLKDGEGTATITGTPDAETGKQESKVSDVRLFVREGAVEVKDITIIQENFSEYDHVVVAGGSKEVDANGQVTKDTTAKMVLDNASIIQTDKAGSRGFMKTVTVGNKDGEGSLILKNNSVVKSGQLFHVGCNSYSNAAHGTYAGTEGDATYFTSNDTNQGYVRIEGGSKIYAGQGLYGGKMTMEIDGAGSELIVGSRVANLNSINSTIIGRVDGATATVNITNGGAMKNYNYILMSMANATSIVNVSGKDSLFAGYGYSYLSGYDKGNASSSISATDNARIHLTYAEMGGETGVDTASIQIDATSSYTGSALVMHKGATVTNNGKFELTDGSVVTDWRDDANVGLDASSIKPKSTDKISSSLEIAGGKFINNGSATTKKLEMNGGSLTNSGQMIVSKDAQITNGEIAFSNGTMRLKGKTDVTGSTITGTDKGTFHFDGNVVLKDTTIEKKGSSSGGINFGSSSSTNTVALKGGNTFIAHKTQGVNILAKSTTAEGNNAFYGATNVNRLSVISGTQTFENKITDSAQTMSFSAVGFAANADESAAINISADRGQVFFRDNCEVTSVTLSNCNFRLWDTLVVKDSLTMGEGVTTEIGKTVTNFDPAQGGFVKETLEATIVFEINSLDELIDQPAVMLMAADSNGNLMLNVAEGVDLSKAKVELLFTEQALKDLEALDEQAVTLNLDKVTDLEGVQLSFTVAESYGKTAEEVFGTTSVETGTFGTGVNTITITKPVPEPTTATLSLLALMGLAARRRRK